MCGVVVSSLHISPLEFWESTPIEIYYSLENYANNRIDSIKEEWERMCLQTYHLINIQIDKNNQLSYNKFKTYMPFTWDEPFKEEEINLEVIDKTFEDFEKFMNKGT